MVYWVRLWLSFFGIFCARYNSGFGIGFKRTATGYQTETREERMHMSMVKLKVLGLSIALIALVLGIVPNATAATVGTHRIWLDLNENGVQDEGEPGLVGVLVELRRSDGALVASTISGENGTYIFNNVPGGSYYEKYALPSGYQFTLKDQGTDDYFDSDADPLTGVTDVAYIAESDYFCSWDAGLVPLNARLVKAGQAGIVPDLPEASAFSSVTVLPGWTWWFFVQSSGGVGSHTYQWYEGSTLLQGQTSMVLAVSKMEPGTYTFFCEVTDAQGMAVTSNFVTLSVIG